MTSLTFIHMSDLPLSVARSYQASRVYRLTMTPEAPIQQALHLARSYHARSTWRALIAITSNYVVIACCIINAQWVSNTPFTGIAGSRCCYPLSTLLIASRMRAFENLVHEASHGNLFPSTSLHQHLQFLYAFPVFRVLDDYRRSHIVHHKHLGNPNKDPDLVRLIGIGLHRIPENPFWYLFGLPMTGYFTYEYSVTTFREFWHTSTSRWSKLAFWFAVLITVISTSTISTFTYYYIIPFMLILPIIRYWAEVAEHLGLDLRSEFGSSRTNVGFLHTWFMNPHDDGYHAVHHLYSKIPFYLLSEAHQQLMEKSAAFSKASVVSYGLVETLQQVATQETIFNESSSQNF